MDQNFLAFIAKGIGSMGYIAIANVIRSILLFPSFNKCFKLETRTNGSAILACITSTYYIGGTIPAFGTPYFSGVPVITSPHANCFLSTLLG